MKFDDHDMKIATDEFIHYFSSSQDQAANTVSDFEEQKENGNIDKAHELGDSISKLVIEDIDNEENLQKNILKVYTITIGIEKHLEKAIVFKTAQSSFVKNIEKNAPDFYEKLKKSGALSLYYLQSRNTKEEETPFEIGKTYASLLGKKEDEKLVKEGTDIFSKTLTIVKEKVDELRFKKKEG